jgi:preprotein translocase subunit SecF
MFTLVEKRRYFFTFSGFLILLGVAGLVVSTISIGTPLRLSIDFTGGTLLSLQFRQAVDEQAIRDTLKEFDLDDIIVQKLSALEETNLPANSRWSLRTETQVSPEDYKRLLEVLNSSVATIREDRSSDQADRQNEGGGLIVLQFESSVEQDRLSRAITDFGLDASMLQVEPTTYPDGSRWSVRTDELTPDQVGRIEDRLEENVAPLDRTATQVSQVSESVGREVTRAAFIATAAATVVILAFIWWAFRKVPHPVRYGACAIIAMIHDILIIVSAVSVLGLIFGWQVDALFLTALLTVVGYSVQDTIVVFDRIRENLGRRRGESYELIVNRSVVETIHRSLATQLNAIFVMVAIVLFGGETIRQFVITLLIGLTSGTYSSIFIAVPLLVSWSKGELPFVNPASDE